MIGADVTVWTYGRYSDWPGFWITTGAGLIITGAPAWTTKLWAFRLITIGACLFIYTFGCGQGFGRGNGNAGGRLNGVGAAATGAVQGSGAAKM